MKFTVKYKSNQTYGTGDGSGNYVASVKRTKSEVVVAFDFKKPPQGKSNPQVTDAAVKSLTINLTETEAMQLAASILAQAHHPSLTNKAAYWMPPGWMPELDVSVWQEHVSIDLVAWAKRIKVSNSSDAHVGRLELTISFRVRSKDGEWKDQERPVSKIVDMLPDTEKEIQIESKDLGLYGNSTETRLISVDIVRVFGMRPQDYKP